MSNKTKDEVTGTKEGGEREKKNWKKDLSHGHQTQKTELTCAKQQTKWNSQIKSWHCFVAWRIDTLLKLVQLCKIMYVWQCKEWQRAKEKKKKKYETIRSVTNRTLLFNC